MAPVWQDCEQAHLATEWHWCLALGLQIRKSTKPAIPFGLLQCIVTLALSIDIAETAAIRAYHLVLTKF